MSTVVGLKAVVAAQNKVIDALKHQLNCANRDTRVALDRMEKAEKQAETAGISKANMVAEIEASTAAQIDKIETLEEQVAKLRKFKKFFVNTVGTEGIRFLEEVPLDEESDEWEEAEYRDGEQAKVNPVSKQADIFFEEMQEELHRPKDEEESSSSEDVADGAGSTEETTSHAEEEEENIEEAVSEEPVAKRQRTTKNSVLAAPSNKASPRKKPAPAKVTPKRKPAPQRASPAKGLTGKGFVNPRRKDSSRMEEERDDADNDDGDDDSEQSGKSWLAKEALTPGSQDVQDAVRSSSVLRKLGKSRQSSQQ